MPRRELVVYVIELSDEIKNKPNFLAANPQGRKECLYVGSTAKAPEARLIDHAEGRPTGSSFIRGFVMGLRPELVPTSKLLSRQSAELRERRHAESLRRRGYFVWQK